MLFASLAVGLAFREDRFAASPTARRSDADSLHVSGHDFVFSRHGFARGLLENFSPSK